MITNRLPLGRTGNKEDGRMKEEFNQISQPVFYVQTKYEKIKITGHMVAADDEADAIRIAEKYNISYGPFGPVRDRAAVLVRGKHPLLPGRHIWYESNGQLQSWIVSKRVA